MSDVGAGAPGPVSDQVFPPWEPRDPNLNPAQRARARWKNTRRLVRSPGGRKIMVDWITRPNGGMTLEDFFSKYR